MKIQIIRTYHTLGTNSKLLIDGVFCCYTIELPWRNNQSNISCIPTGTYPLVKRITKKRGPHLLVRNIPNRTLVLIHPANNALKELHGCIAPVTTLTGEGTGTESRKASELVYKQVFAALEKGQEVMLEVVSG